MILCKFKDATQYMLTMLFSFLGFSLVFVVVKTSVCLKEALLLLDQCIEPWQTMCFGFNVMQTIKLWEDFQLSFCYNMK